MAQRVRFASREGFAAVLATSGGCEPRQAALAGAEIVLNTRVTGLYKEQDRIRGVTTASSEIPVVLGQVESQLAACYGGQGVIHIPYLALPTFLRRILPLFRQPKPAEKPADFPDVWPNYFVAAAFYHNRLFGLWFLLGLIVNAALVVWVL